MLNTLNWPNAASAAQTDSAQQDHRLRKIVTYAYDYSDYYRELMQGAGLTPADIDGVSDLHRLPLSTKAALAEQPLARLQSSDPTLGRKVSESSSGSTGTPFTVAFDRRYLWDRNWRFLQGLLGAGYRWPDKLMLLTGDKNGRVSAWRRWRYVSLKLPAAEVTASYREFRPQVLYGCVTPLRELALQLLSGPAGYWRPRVLVTTAEALDGATRQLLSEAFGCAVFDFYGMTEMGLVARECRAHSGYHLAPGSVVTELLPLNDGSGLSRLVYTNLALRATPLLRYVSGDLAQGYTEQDCSCGNRHPRVARFEGRELDMVLLADGSRRSPYQFTCVLEQFTELRRYKVIQLSKARILVQLEGCTTLTDQLLADVRRTVDHIVAGQARIKVQQVECLKTTPGVKFRVVESRLRDNASSSARQLTTNV